MRSPNNNIFRVLTLDGGGIRGLYSASVIRRLLALFNSPVTQDSYDFGKSFDLICGTSTGAILACALAAGVPIKEIVDLYVEHGKAIFPKPTPTGKKLLLWGPRHLNKPSSNHQILRSALSAVLGNKTLGQIYEERNIGLCIPTVNADNHQALVFKTPHTKSPNKGKRDINQTLVNICMASSAAPILLPIHCQKDPDNEHASQHFVDGGLWANSPVLVGLIDALDIAPPESAIEILSIGTCDRPNGDPAALENPNWGIWRWRAGVNIVEMSLAAQAFGHQHMARILAEAFSKLGKKINIIRLNQTSKSPEKFSAIGLDKADKTAIDTLLAMAREDAEIIHSKATSNNPDEYRPLTDIFTNLAQFGAERR